MGELFSTLDRIARENAVRRIKQQTPPATCYFLRGCHADLQPYGSQLDHLLRELNNMKQRSAGQLER